jgi:hypothetical protein
LVFVAEDGTELQTHMIKGNVKDCTEINLPILQRQEELSGN